MTTTRWTNPTRNTMKVKLFISPDEPERVYEIPPGETREIPSEFDRAIHRTETRGDAEILTGGMAPLLVREGQTYPLHHSLMPTRDSNPLRALFPDEIKARLRADAESDDSNPIMARVRAAKGGAR